MQRFALRQKDYDYLLEINSELTISLVPRLIMHGQEELLIRLITNKHTEPDGVLLCDYIDGKIKANQISHLQLESGLLALLTGKRIKARPMPSYVNRSIITATAAVLGKTESCLKASQSSCDGDDFICRWALKANQMETFTACLPYCEYHPEDLFRRAVKYGRLEAIPILTQNLHDRCRKTMQKEAEKKSVTLTFVSNWQG